ncbi:MAG: DUF305 domain-containing protein [Pseudomonadota bacterium]|nr:DUF305 domain-containing protein [Pseudomonadota bacterium]
MNSVSKTALIVALAAGLAACAGESGTPANEAGAETANIAQASGPFAESEQRMSDAMMAAIGTDAGDSWAKKMAVHHQGAIEMSEIVLQQNPRPDVADMARMTIEKQRKEIEDLRKLFKEGAPDPQSAELYRPAMMAMHQKMQAASGADISETFLRKMHEHHLGGVAMSDIALQIGVSGALREQVQKTRDDQLKEARMIEAMLRGETMQHAMQETGVKSVEEAKAEHAPADKAKAALKPAAKTSPKAQEPKAKPKPAPAAQPTAEPKPATSTCLPEHRAAGHC